LSFHSYENIADVFLSDIATFRVDYNTANTNGMLPDIPELTYQGGSWICLGRYYDLVEWLDHVPPKKIPTMGMFLGQPMVYGASTPREMEARDRRIIYEMLADCCLIKALQQQEGFGIPGEDRFTQGAIQMLRSRRIPIWFIFACQVQCDIRYILETDAVQCHRELQATGKRVSSILRTYSDFNKDFDVPKARVIDITIQEAEIWAMDDFMGPERLKLHLDHGVPRQFVEPFHYLRSNPLICGLMIFRFSLTFNELGLVEANMWGATSEYLNSPFGLLTACHLSPLGIIGYASTNLSNTAQHATTSSCSFTDTGSRCCSYIQHYET